MQTSCPPVRQIKIVTVLVCLLALLFVGFFNLSKHNPLLSPANVFNEDPFDAVGSFGIQLASLAAFLSFIRILKPGPSGAAPENLGAVLRADLVVLLAVSITLLADGIALLRYLPIWTALPGGPPLLALTVGLFVLTLLVSAAVLRLGSKLRLSSGSQSIVIPLFFGLAAVLILTVYPESIRQSTGGAILTALVGTVILFSLAVVLATWIFPPDDLPPEDILDDLACLYRWAKGRLSRLRFLFGWLEKLAALPPVRFLVNLLNPRRHAMDIILLIALLVGMGLMIAESFGEDIPSVQTLLLVLSVLIGLEAAGVALGFLLFNQYLRIFNTR